MHDFHVFHDKAFDSSDDKIIPFGKQLKTFPQVTSSNLNVPKA